MNFMQRWKRFWTLERRSNSGFTLVELVVVIAILAILAGVGSAAYSGYIKSANKNADKVLVGNVMKAIETGTHSTAFTPPEPLSIGTTTYPIGFIALSTDGCTVLSSSSSEKQVDGECEFVTETITYVKMTNTTLYCEQDNKHTTIKPIYSLDTKTLTYCKTHSNKLPETLTSVKEYPIAYKYEKEGLFHLSHKLTITDTLEITTGTYFMENIYDLYTETSSGLCMKAATPGLNVSADPATDGVLYDAIHAAFGSNELKLKYVGWINDEGADFATFYTYAPSVFNNVKDQTALLISAVNSDTINGLAQMAGINLSSYLTEGKYEDSADLMKSFTNFVSNNMTEEEWAEQWEKASTASHDEWTFGVDTKGAKNDYIWAARMAYNSSFASYCSTNGIASIYTDLIVNYGESELGGAIQIPSVVNHYAFAQTGEGSLLQSFLDKDATNGQVMFDQCKSLYESYLNSSVANENGSVFYNTVNTIAETSDVAAASGDYFGFYNNYLTEMSNLYTAAQAASENGIMIIVTMENGTLNFQVSPSAANPRNE